MARSSSKRSVLSNEEEDEKLGSYLYESQQLESRIRKDINRTFSKFTFFQEPNIQDLFVRILMVTSRMRNIDYQQGFSELLAVVFFLLYIEKIEGSHIDRYDSVSDEYGVSSGIISSSYLSKYEKELIDKEILGDKYTHLPSSKNIKNSFPDSYYSFINRHDTLELLYVLLNGDFIEHDAFISFF